jgi:hypothetical protein
VGRHAAAPVTEAVETARPRHGDLKDRHSGSVHSGILLANREGVFISGGG